MRVAVAVFILTLSAVKCMPSLSLGGQDLTDGLDTSVPTGLNGQDSMKVDVGADLEEGVTLKKEEKTHTENNSEEEKNEDHAHDHSEKYGDETHSVNQTSHAHSKHSKNETHDETDEQALTLGRGGLTMTHDKETEDEKNEANENSGQQTYSETETGPNSNHTLESGSEYSKTNATHDKKAKKAHKKFTLGADGSSDFAKKDSSTEQHDEENKSSGSSFKKEEETTQDKNGVHKSGSGSGTGYEEEEASSSQRASEHLDEKHSDGDKAKENNVNDLLKHRVQNAVKRYLEYDEKRLIFNNDNIPPRNTGIIEDPNLVSKLKQDYLLTIAKKIHDTKIVKTPKGNAIVANAQHSAESQLPNYDSYVGPEYRTLAQKFGYSPVSSHYANAQLIQQKYANIPSRLGFSGKFGSENDVYGDEYGIGKTQYGDREQGFLQYDAENTRQLDLEDLQLSVAGWEEYARKKAEIQNSQFNKFGQGTGIDYNAGRLHTINPFVRDVLFSQNIEDILHPTKNLFGNLDSTFKILGYSDNNNKVNTVPKNIPSKAISYTGPANYFNSKNKFKGRHRINDVNNNYGSKQAENSYRAKDRSKIVIGNTVNSDVASDMTIAENTEGNNSVYGRSTNVATENTSDKEGSNDVNDNTDSRTNSMRVVQSSIDNFSDNGTLGDTYDIKNSSDKVGSDYSLDTSTKSESRSETFQDNLRNESSGDFYDIDQIDLKHTEEKMAGNQTLNGNFNELEYGGNNSTVVNNSSVAIRNLDEPVPMDSLSKNNNYGSDFNNTSEAKAIDNENGDSTGDADTKIEESDLKYSTDANIFDNKTSTEPDTSTLTSFQANTDRSDYYNASKVDKVDESLKLESSTSGNDGFNVTSQAAGDESRDTSLVVNTDSNDNKSNTEYSPSVDKPDNETLSETDISTITAQIMNTTEFDSNDATKYDFDVPVTVDSNSGNGGSVSGVISQVKDNNSSNIDFSYNADSNVDNGATEYYNILDKSKINTTTEADRLQVTANDTTVNYDVLNDVGTTNNYATADLATTSTLPSIVDGSIEKSTSTADTFATSTFRTTIKDEYNNDGSKFDDLLEPNKTNDSTNIDSLIVDSSNPEAESTAKLEVNSQSTSGSELSGVTEKPVIGTFETNQSTSIVGNASTITNNSTEGLNTLISNSVSTLRDVDTVSSTTEINRAEAFDKLTDATTTVSFGDKSYSSDTSTTRATLDSGSDSAIAFDSTVTDVTEANGNSTNTSFETSVATPAAETPDLSTGKVDGSTSDRVLNDITQTSTNIASTNDSDGNYVSTDKSVTLSPLDSAMDTADNSTFYNVMDLSNTTNISTHNSNADVIDRDSSNKIIDSSDASVITTSSPITDLTSSSSNATSNDSSTDSTVTIESNIDNSETPALATTTKTVNDEENTSSSATETNTPADIKPDTESPVTLATLVSSTDNSSNVISNRLDKAGIVDGTNLATGDATAADVTEDKVHSPARQNGAVDYNHNTDESLKVKVEDKKEIKTETVESKSDESASKSTSIEPSIFSNSGVDSVNTDESASRSIESNLS